MSSISLMGILDRLFIIIFARYRRKRGDANLNTAWQLASYVVSIYVSWPIVAVVAFIVITGYSIIKVGDSTEHWKIALVAVVVIALIASFLLDRRFQKYLRDPPELPVQESREDRMFVFWFHATAIGIFVLIALILPML